MRRNVILCGLLLSFTLLQACTPVRFNKKALLNDPMMQFDHVSSGSEMQGHMTAPREASIGGFNSVSGGGCSCK